MSVIIQRLFTGYDYLMGELADPRVAHLPLMSSPIPVILLLLLYRYFVRSLGPRLMQYRPPMDLYYPMMLYNWVQIAINGFFVYKAFSVIWIPRKYSLVCEPVDYSDDPVALEVAFYSWVYFMVKVADLLDTVFMVLRKKDRQVSFLHVYHHMGMVVTGWIATKYVAGGHGIFFGTVNSLVHTIMYCYYQLMLIKPEYKSNIWWKKHITEIQLIQFVLTSVHASAALLNPNCNFPKHLLAVFIPQDVFMFFLFLDFYRKAYLPKKIKADSKSN